jgi:hypothetical protein
LAFKNKPEPETSAVKCAHCGNAADVNRVGDQIATVEVWRQPMCYPCFDKWERECPRFIVQLGDELGCKRYVEWTREWCTNAMRGAA